MEKFVTELWESLKKELTHLKQKELGSIDLHKASLLFCNKALQELKLYIYAYHFVNQEEEIHFHKYLAPKFNSAYIFHYRAWKFSLSKSIYGKKAKNREEKEINRFLLRNAELYSYMARNDNYLDAIYYTKIKAQLEIPFDEEFMQIIDKQFVTAHSYKIAQLQAYKKLSFWLQKQQNCISSQNNQAQNIGTNLNWTDTGMSLTEMAYALKYSGAINQGNVDVKTIADALAQVFNTQQVNIYRNKQDLYSRKNQSMFIDKLRKDLIRGLEQSDLGS
ncbi:RteC domain-containing protein [Rhizosphaericola mali]|uniref:RteC protein n=1 Tax=Rhizosphaericola mali TaxID=2545455 RepID=A0A5P2G1I6_9BACT|nr:RteC domain-containing protein [Rhizosphaericola mali]QES89666.1 hypothetical protein E0W69_013685 [Rhizosphaericola mali]